MKYLLRCLPLWMVLMLAACSTTTTSHGDYAHYNDLSELYEASDLVITGIVTHHEVVSLNEIEYDVYDIDPVHIYKNKPEALEHRKVRFLRNELKELTTGSEYLFFLYAYDTSIPPMAMNVLQSTYINDQGSLSNVADSQEGFADAMSIDRNGRLLDKATSDVYNASIFKE